MICEKLFAIKLTCSVNLKSFHTGKIVDCLFCQWKWCHWVYGFRGCKSELCLFDPYKYGPNIPLHQFSFSYCFDKFGPFNVFLYN